MKTRRITKALIALTATFALGATTIACGPRNPDARADWMVKKISNKLDLTDTQRPKLQAIADYFKAERKANREKHRDTFDFALAQVKADQLDRKAIQARINSRLDDMKQKSPRLVELVAEFHASLTPEQKAEAAEHMEKWRKRFAKYHGDEE
jgi:Spy/CpxP family protein refolding chaperone